MRRWILVLVGIVAVFAVGGGVWLSRDRGTPSFASLRQARTEEVPGTFGVTLTPPPAGFDPVVSPRQVYRTFVRRPPPGGVMETLAIVSSPYASSADEVPAWVLIGRGVCDATSKGDVVSPGRSDPSGEGMSCPKESLLMGVIDATTGRLLGAYRGYDLSGTWAPAQGPS